MRVDGKVGGFEKLLKLIEAKSPADRLQKVGRSQIRFGKITEDSEGVGAIGVLIRMDDFPVVVSLAGGHEDLDIEDDQGVGERIGLYYWKTKGVIALEVRRVLATSRVEDYFIYHSDSQVSLRPILKKNEYGRYLDLEKVTRISAKVESPANGKALMGGALSQLFKMREDTGAHTLEVVVSTGRSGEPLERKQANAIVKQLKDSGETRKLEVTGRNEEGREFIDFIADRLADEVDMSEPGLRTVPDKTRLSTVKMSLHKHKKEIIEIVG